MVALLRHTTPAPADVYLALPLDALVCALPLAHVGEVASADTAPAFRRQPTSSHAGAVHHGSFLGYTRLNGLCTPVVDLAHAVRGKRPAATPSRHSCLVTAFAQLPAGGILQLGLRIGRLPRLVSFTSEEILSAPAGDGLPALLGVARPRPATARQLPPGDVLIIDIDRLLPDSMLAHILAGAPNTPDRAGGHR